MVRRCSASPEATAAARLMRSMGADLDIACTLASDAYASQQLWSHTSLAVDVSSARDHEEDAVDRTHMCARDDEMCLDRRVDLASQQSFESILPRPSYRCLQMR